MGTLTLPASGLVYVDANSVIYTVEKHPVYGPLLQPLWQAAQAKAIEVVSSDLVLMETLVGPFKSGDTALERGHLRHPDPGSPSDHVRVQVLSTSSGPTTSASAIACESKIDRIALRNVA